MPWKPPPKQTAKKQANPIWQGIGFLLIPVYLGGSYLAAKWFIEQNSKQGWIPALYALPQQQQLIGLMILLMIVGFSIVTMIFGMMRGPVGGPLDVRGSSGRRPKKRY